MAKAMVAILFPSTTLLVVVMEVVMQWASMTSAFVYVDIYHDMRGPDSINVNCSKGSNPILILQRLLYGQHSGWQFKPNMFKVTKYYCTFAWKTFTMTIRVYNDNPLFGHRLCSNCLWQVKKDGFWLIDVEGTDTQSAVFESGWICSQSGPCS